MRSTILGVLAGLVLTGCPDENESSVGTDPVQDQGGTASNADGRDLSPSDMSVTDTSLAEAEAEVGAGGAGGCALDDAARPDGAPLVDRGVVDMAPPADRAMAEPEPDGMAPDGMAPDGMAPGGMAPAEGCRPPEPLDALETARYEGVEWLDELRTTGNQRVVLDEIERVLFIGDEALLAIPQGIDRANGAQFATIRGRLTRMLANLLPLTAPAEDPFWELDWYQPDRNGRIDLSAEDEASFNVCAHPGASWADLSFAIDEPNADGVDGLYPGCLQDVPGAGGTLLVFVVFGAYGPAQYAADQRALRPRGAQHVPGDPLGLYASEELAALSEMFTSAREAGRFRRVVILTMDLVAWRAGASPCGDCDPAMDEPGFADKLTSFNQTLVNRSGAERYDVLVTDATARRAAAVCLEDEREAGREVCNMLPDEDTLANGERLDTAPWQACCWTAGAACAQPDRDGHLVIAEDFIDYLEALAVGPAR